MERDQHVSEKQIDRALEATFPASDPVSLHSTGTEAVPKRAAQPKRGWLQRLFMGGQRQHSAPKRP